MDDMHAFRVPGPGVMFRPVRCEMPQPGPDQVRVRVQACGICRSDAFAVSGLPGARYPLIPGHEIAGVVDAVGSAVRNWAPGNRVGVGWFGGQCGECDSCRRGTFVTCADMRAPGLFADGGYAEYVVVPAAALVRVPDGVDPVHVAPLMCAGVTAFTALRRGAATAGSRVAVVGVGGVGHLAIQFARHMGCETIAVSRGGAKEESARRLGAHHFVDSSDSGAVEKIAKLGGADVVIVTSPAGGEVRRLTPAVAPHGRIVVTGFSAEPVQADSVDLISRNLCIMGSAAGTPVDAEEALRFSVLNAIRPVVVEFPFDAAGDAYAQMLAGSVWFRAVLTVDATAAQTSSGTRRESNQPGGDGGMSQAPAVVTGRADPVLDCPPDQVPDVDELIHAAMRWHFGPNTGSAFWLERVKDLDFDPVTDVHCPADLRLFPNVVDELRTVRVADLIPQGFGDDPGLVGVFESGGATGAPKRVVLLRDWLERFVAWEHRTAREHGQPHRPNVLLVAPTGPHLMTYQLMEGIRRRGGVAFTVDLDPRWVRKCLHEGRVEDVERYADHLLAQSEAILRTQDVNVLTITPPLLERLARQPRLVDLLREKVSVIAWGGTHMDGDTRRLYRTEVFPGIRLQGGYGSTMVLAGSVERPGLADDDPCIFDPFSPYVTYSVVDPSTGQEVPFGERGQVLAHHISKAMFLPNNLERDTALRIAGLSGQAGDSVADVTPVQTSEARAVTEGVY